MSASDSGFGSNNPFRRNTSVDPSPATKTTSGSSAPSSSFLNAAAAAATAAASPLTSAPRPPPPTSFTTFRNVSSEAQDAGARNEETIQGKPKRVVKKVRVQSPPPSSPEDATPARSYPPNGYSDDSSSVSTEDMEQLDPFSSSYSEPPRSVVDDEPPLPRAPPNPFSKTLQDLEQTTNTQEGLAGEGGKGSLDVDSFKRLLLTGYANIPGPGGQGAFGNTHDLQQPAVHYGDSITDASSVSRQSTLDAVQETPRTSHEISEAEESTYVPSSVFSSAQPITGRKKPPPPSSRHGKLIKLELRTEGSESKGLQPAISINTTSPIVTGNRKSSVHSIPQPSPPSSSDINKPLPLPPTRPAGEEGVDSPFDQEAAGKLPESLAALSTSPRPLTPPGESTRARSESQTSTQTTSSTHRKPAAPPPRRQGHGRSESKPSSILSDRAEEDPPRSSLESNRSRADSLQVNVSSDKSLSAPVPPPPRRPNHARQGSSFASPTTSGFVNVPSPGTSDESRLAGIVGFNPREHQNAGAMATVTHKDGLPKLSPPPPPPARHSSLRRPSSSHNSETGSIRRVSREKEGGAAPPPPPPPKARGASRSSLAAMDASAVAGRSMTGSEVSTVDEEPSPTIENSAIDPGTGGDIMAQLRALQQEVEAARKGSG